MDINKLREDLKEMLTLLEDPQTGFALWWKMLARPWSRISVAWDRISAEYRIDEMESKL